MRGSSVRLAPTVETVAQSPLWEAVPSEALWIALPGRLPVAQVLVPKDSPARSLMRSLDSRRDLCRGAKCLPVLGARRAPVRPP